MPKAKKDVSVEKVCANCKKGFTAFRRHAKFCSVACRVQHWRDENEESKFKDFLKIKRAYDYILRELDEHEDDKVQQVLKRAKEQAA